MRRSVAKAKGLPEHFQRITTYRELEQFAEAFAKGSLSFLGVFGKAGLAKSRTIRQALGARACWIDGNVSPFGIYMLAYEHRNQSIVLDDVDGLYRDRNGVRLLKALCQTEREKTLCWETDAKTLEDRGIPRQFPTTSHVAIIANQWKSLNADVAALEDRGHFLYFDPLSVEVHRQAGTWFWDQEIFDFIAQQLHLMESHSLRTYWRAAELKKA